MTRSRRSSVASLLGAAPIALLIAACGERSGEGSAANRSAGANDQAAAARDGAADNSAASACVATDTTAVRVAVLEYITKADPRPQRFLSAFGTDSAVPEDGFKALQDKGPTYYWNDNPKNQQQVRDKLDAAGPYATMLVVYKGKTESDNGNTVTVKLGGHYVGGELEGKLATPRDITVRCDSTGWRLPK